MNKQEVLAGLELFRERLLGEVVGAYEQRGGSFGSIHGEGSLRNF